MTTPKRNPVQRRFERDLERALDAMHARREQRVLARSTFRSLTSGPVKMRYSSALHRAVRDAQSLGDAASGSPRDVVGRSA